MLDDFELDSERSRDWSTALVQYAVVERPANTELLKQWVKDWKPLAYRGMERLVDLFGQAPHPLQSHPVAAKVRAAHHALLTRYTKSAYLELAPKIVYQGLSFASRVRGSCPPDQLRRCNALASAECRVKTVGKPVEV
jgi:hypothetical protein